jgi:TetR/AcrR family transcriptional repressor of nem operon
MKTAVLGFFDENEAWLAAVLEQGREERTLAFAGSVRDTARMIVSGLEGAMLVTRPYGDTARFEVAAASLLASVTGTARGGGADESGLPASFYCL